MRSGVGRRREGQKRWQPTCRYHKPPSPRRGLLAASPGGLRPPRTAPTGASGASGLTGGATAPPDPPTGASGAPEAPVGG
eukprot:8979431-Alexandrium_andersonii.AAC.1